VEQNVWLIGQLLRTYVSSVPPASSTSTAAEGKNPMVEDDDEDYAREEETFSDNDVALVLVTPRLSLVMMINVLTTTFSGTMNSLTTMCNRMWLGKKKGMLWQTRKGKKSKGNKSLPQMLC
jgi:hypothetical protein